MIPRARRQETNTFSSRKKLQWLWLTGENLKFCFELNETEEIWQHQDVEDEFEDRLPMGDPPFITEHSYDYFVKKIHRVRTLGFHWKNQADDTPWNLCSELEGTTSWWKHCLLSLIWNSGIFRKWKMDQRINNWTSEVQYFYIWFQKAEIFQKNYQERFEDSGNEWTNFGGIIGYYKIFVDLFQELNPSCVLISKPLSNKFRFPNTHRNVSR